VDLTSLYYTDYLGFYRATVKWHDMPTLLAVNIDELFRSIGDLFIYGLDRGFFSNQLRRLLALFAFAGVIRLVRTGRYPQYLAFALLYIATLLNWNYPPTERLVLPVFPLLLAGLITELWHLAKLLRIAAALPKLPERIVAGLAATAVVCLCVFVARQNYQMIAGFLPSFMAQCREKRTRSLPAYAWISKNTPTGARYLAYNDPLLYLYTGRQACRMPPNPLDIYRQDGAAALQPFRQVNEFAQRWNLTHAFVSRFDYDTDLVEPLRTQALSILRSNPGLQAIDVEDAGIVAKVRTLNENPEAPTDWGYNGFLPRQK
jgi:hypothetical protein